jgi:hypothetical protein
MSDVALEPRAIPLDAKALLARVNAELVRLRRALSHDHGDEAFWASLELDVNLARKARGWLRIVAHLLHVERASSRGRIHGRVFASLDEQTAWLTKMERRTCIQCAQAAGLPVDATLAKLRAGLL